jgi:drug/metabolite transporter (DMT)-like permease
VFLLSFLSSFTFLFSSALLSEQFKWSKLAPVLLCMVKTIVVTLADSTEVGGSFSRDGWILCLFSAKEGVT